MLNNIRKFSKTIFAKILLVIIIIPFVFWGMGGVFNSGNSNNIAKVNNYNISTQDFMDYLNNSNINTEYIRSNLDKNILEELLSGLVSQTIINLEIEELKLSISEDSLAKKIRENKNFLDDNMKFSRIKYEKFLLSKNLTAPGFEKNLKQNELQKKLFSFISGGIKSSFFMTNDVYKEQNRKLEIKFIDLSKNYKKKNSYDDDEINFFINENLENLKEDYIDFSYIKINPIDLTGSVEFNELFFKKIDELENKITNGSNFDDLTREIKIKPIVKKNYIKNPNSVKIEEIIYEKKNENKIQLIDQNEYYVLYSINKINNILPSLENNNFKNKIKDLLYEKNKFTYNKILFDKINNKKFNDIDFTTLSENIKTAKLDSIKDDKLFELESIKILYSLPINSFTLIADKDNNIFVAKIINSSTKNITKNNIDFLKYNNQSIMKIRDNIYSSYDFFLNEKFEVTINQKTLERVKNYFR